MNLSNAPINKKLLVSRISQNNETTKRLAALGIVEGAHVSLYSVQRGGVILYIKDSRLAVDQYVASSIEVIEEEEK